MKKLFLLITICCVILGFVSNGWANPYKSKKFPSKNEFEDYKGKRYISIGKKHIIKAGHYCVFGFYKKKNNTIGWDYLGEYMQLDNGYWAQRLSDKESWQIFDPKPAKP